MQGTVGNRFRCSRLGTFTAPRRLAAPTAAGWHEGRKSELRQRSGQSSRPSSYSRGGSEQGRSQPLPQRQPRSPREPSQERYDPSGFKAFHASLCEGQSMRFVIRSEAWPKLFSLISSKEDADLVMALMLQDAGIRDESNWDWITHGYGQTIFQLVKAAGAARAYHVCDWVLDNMAALRLTVNNDTIPNFMRKLGAVDAGAREIERLYQLELTVRGRNTSAGFYELSRAYKRSGDADQLAALLDSATKAGVVIKEDVLEDVTAWLQKRR